MAKIALVFYLGLVGMPWGVLGKPSHSSKLPKPIDHSSFKFIQSMDKNYKDLTILPTLLAKVVNLDCETTRSNAVVTLWHTRLYTKPYKQVPMQGKKVYISKGAQFTITNISYKDIGFYQCRAGIPGSNQEIVRRFKVMISYTNPYSLVMKPASPEIKAYQGKGVSFKCETTVNNTIVWYYYPNDAQKDAKAQLHSSPKYQINQMNERALDGRMVFNSTLTISNVQAADNGHYACVIILNGAELMRDSKLVVEMPQVPSFKYRSVTMVVRKKASTTLDCHTSGRPTPMVTGWQLNGKAIHGCVKVYTQRCSHTDYIIKGNNLTIKHVNSRHSGKFTCTVQNSQGAAQKDFIVRVLGSPEIDRRKTSSLVLAYGYQQSVKIPVYFKYLGHPAPTIEWELYPCWPNLPCKFAKEYAESAKKSTVQLPTKDHPKTVLTVPDIMSIGGILKMTATNSHGSDSIEIKFWRKYT